MRSFMKNRAFSVWLAMLLCLSMAMPAAAAGYSSDGNTEAADVLNEQNLSDDSAELQGETMEIRTADDLLQFAERAAEIPDLNAVLMADIDISHLEWRPIGLDARKIYQGTFDGNGFTINGLTTRAFRFDTDIGLFFRIGENAAVKNLTMSNVDMNFGIPGGYSIHGGALAYCSEGLIESCFVSGRIRGENAIYLGGLVGELGGGTIRDCTVDLDMNVHTTGQGSMNTGYSHIGGIAGTAFAFENPLIENCRNLGTITYTGPANECGTAYIGGITTANINIINCCNMGDISVRSGAYSNMPVYAAGISAFEWEDPDVEFEGIVNCYNTGAVHADVGGLGVLAGGITAVRSEKVRNCWSSGEVTGSSGGDSLPMFRKDPSVSVYYLNDNAAVGGCGQMVSQKDAAGGVLCGRLNAFVSGFSKAQLTEWEQNGSVPVLKGQQTDRLPKTYPSVKASDTSGWMTWSLDESGCLTVRGEGRLDWPLAAWSDYSSDIRTLDIGEGITIIDGNWDFYPQLEEVRIPASMTEIGLGFFGGEICPRLKSIKVAAGNPAFSDRDGVLFNKDQKELIAYPAGRDGDYVIPSGVTSVGECAFQSCLGLTGITIPDSVETVGGHAFEYCCCLQSITLSKGMNEIGPAAFFACAGVKKLTVPSGVTRIREKAFRYCANLQEVVLSSGVKRVGANAFADCPDLKDLTVPVTLTVVASDFAGGYGSLSDIWYEGSEEQWNKISVFYDNGDDGSAGETSVRMGDIEDTGAVLGRAKIHFGEKKPDGNGSSGTGTNGFADVPDNAFFAEAVKWAVQAGVTNGTSATTFSPSANCTRAHVVTFLWRAAGSPAVDEDEAPNAFEDVPFDTWYTDAVRWAAAKGITSGTSDTTFSPQAPCTRAQIVTFLWRFEGEPEWSGDTGFSDVSSSAYFVKPVGWAVQQGITKGMDVGIFAPSAICTRGQVVTFLHRYVKM